MGVLQYIAKRIGLYFVVLFIGLTITFLLPRFMPAESVSPLVFEAWLTGAADWLPRRRTYAYR